MSLHFKVLISSVYFIKRNNTIIVQNRSHFITPWGAK
jgi:hypothetical protein